MAIGNRIRSSLHFILSTGLFIRLFLLVWLNWPGTLLARVGLGSLFALGSAILLLYAYASMIGFAENPSKLRDQL